MAKPTLISPVVLSFALLASAFPNSFPQQALPTRTPAAQDLGETIWITGNSLKLKTRIYVGSGRSANPILIVVLHGDSPFRPPSYQYAFARQTAEQIPDVIAAAILRPGYTDDVGDRSEGERGLTTGDNYTPQVVDSISQVIEQLKSKYHPRDTVLVGHSGGAAIAGDVLGRSPALVNAALMVSCPCELQRWREHMLKLQKADIWKKPVESLSPFDLASKVNRAVQVVGVVVGKTMLLLRNSQRNTSQL